MVDWCSGNILSCQDRAVGSIPALTVNINGRILVLHTKCLGSIPSKFISAIFFYEQKEQMVAEILG